MSMNLATESTEDTEKEIVRIDASAAMASRVAMAIPVTIFIPLFLRVLRALRG
jgi:hypothetical protein